MSILAGDFKWVNQWSLERGGDRWYDYTSSSFEPKFLIDETTGRRYLNEDMGVVRTKCFLLSLATPLVHSIALLSLALFSAMKSVSLYHFWKPVTGEVKYHFEARLNDFQNELADFLLCLSGPLLLEMAAIYGLLSPYDGRKIYASFERALYGGFLLAPCFQPEPIKHALGGNIHRRNAY